MPRATLYSRPLPDYLLALLAQKVPAYGMGVVTRLVHIYDFAFRFARPRSSKLGDFTRSGLGQFSLTVNADLSPELFLITFLHEVAHLEATLGRKRREAPHGLRWKRCYGALLQELCRDADGLMDADLRLALLAHSQNPTATLHADARLALLLLPKPAELEVQPEGHTLAERLEEGTSFLYRGRAFVMGGKLRKRHYATELATGKLYSFVPTCHVRMLDPAQTRLSAHNLLLCQQVEPGQVFVHRSRRFRLEEQKRSRMFCTDLKTGNRVELHGLMHVAV